MNKKLDLASGDIESILGAWESDTAAPVVLRDRSYKTLQRHGLMTEKATVYKNIEVGTHPSNRAKTILEIQEVPRKTKNFKSGGFSLSECNRAVAVERPPGEEGDKWEKKNQDIVIKSNEQLAPVATGSLKIFSTACSHTKEVLKAVGHGARSDDKDISSDGRISKEMACGGNEDYIHAVENGIPWKVINYVVALRYPLLIDLICSADNVPMAMSKADSVFQILRKIHQEANSIAEINSEGEAVVDWDRVEHRVARSELNRITDLPELVRFVRYKSGGLNNPIVLDRIEAWLLNTKKSSELSPVVLGRLAHLSFPPNIGAHWITACCQIMVFCIDCNRNGESKYYSPADVAQMQGGLMKFVLQADELLRKVPIASAIRSHSSNTPTFFHVFISFRTILFQTWPCQQYHFSACSCLLKLILFKDSPCTQSNNFNSHFQPALTRGADAFCRFKKFATLQKLLNGFAPLIFIFCKAALVSAWLHT